MRSSGSTSISRPFPSDVRHPVGELLQPDSRLRVGRRTPIAARRKGASGSHLRTVRQTRALELTQLEEPAEEYPEPVLDDQKGVLAAPGVAREKRDLAGTEAVSTDVVQIEILQRERSDHFLGMLHRLRSRLAPARHELRRNPGVANRPP